MRFEAYTSFNEYLNGEFNMWRVAAEKHLHLIGCAFKSQHVLLNQDTYLMGITLTAALLCITACAQAILGNVTNGCFF